MTEYYVTGSSGFLGSHVCSLLADAGNTVYAVSRSGSRIAKCVNLSVKDYSDLEVKADSVCIHLAEINNASKVGEQERNEHIRVLSALIRKPFNKLIYSSSSSIYGDLVGSPHREDENIDPVSFTSNYQRSKFDAERTLLSDTRDNVVLRFANIYGTGMSYDSVIMTIVSQLQNFNGIIKLKSLKPSRDFLHVNDAASAVVVTSHMPEAKGIFNIGSGNIYSVSQLLEYLTEISGRLVDNIEVLNPDIENSNLQIDVSKARLQLGWNAKIDLVTGLKDLLLSQQQFQ